MILQNLQLMCFEVTSSCNLASVHDFCPSNMIKRIGTPATNQEFLDFLYYCIQHGFTGNVGFHRFNEPTLDIERCKILNDRVHTLGLSSTMWTNGTYKDDLTMFDNVYLTQYIENDGCTKKIPYQPDTRIKIYETEPIEIEKYKSCYRPSYIELPIDYFGNIYMCCGDWNGKIRTGNIRTDNFDNLLLNWGGVIDLAMRGCELCRRCQGLEGSPACLDPNIIV